MAKARPYLSVVIPAFREAERIEETLKVTRKELDGLSHEILVIDDGSPDSTAAVVTAWLKRQKGDCPVRLISYSPNQGKGFALKRGVMEARGKCIAFLDADLDISPDHITRYLEILETEEADAVVGSKRHPESRLEYAKSRVFISNIYYLFNRIVFRLRVKDTQSGMKVFRAAVLQKVVPTLLVKRFAFDLELLVNLVRGGARIIEAPLAITGHASYGRFGFKPLWHALLDTLAVFFRLHLLRFYDWPVLPAPLPAKNITVFIDARDYNPRLVGLVASLTTLPVPRLGVVILAEQGNFAVAGATVLDVGSAPLPDKLWSGLARTQAPLVAVISERMVCSPGWLLPVGGYFVDGETVVLAGPVQRAAGSGFFARLYKLATENVFATGRRNIFFKLRRQREVLSFPLNNCFLRRETLTGILDNPDAVCQDEFGQYWAALPPEATGRGLYTPDISITETIPARPFRGYYSRLHRSWLGAGCALVHGSHVSLRVLFPAMVLLFVLLAGLFSVFSALFRDIFLAGAGVFLGVLYFSVGKPFAPWFVLPAMGAVLWSGVARATGVLRGVFRKHGRRA